MRLIRILAVSMAVCAAAFAQAQPESVNSIFSSGLASSLLAADTVPGSITSVNSATDFGGMSTIAAGSWIEIKGTNQFD